MVETFELFVAFDVSKDSHAVAVAESGRNGEVRSHGAISSDPAAVRRLVRKLERPGLRLRFCYEAGPTGYGLKRQIEELGHECAVIAPSLARQCKRAQQDLFEEPPPDMRLRAAERTKAVQQLRALLMEALASVSGQRAAGDDQDHA